MEDLDPENHARLSGLLAMVALPLVRGDLGMMRRVRVEVEVAPGTWRPIEGAAVELGKLTVWTGTNGSRTQWEFLAAQCPRWRSDSNRERKNQTYIEEDDQLNYRPR